jgi:hypothetical protein
MPFGFGLHKLKASDRIAFLDIAMGLIHGVTFGLSLLNHLSVKLLPICLLRPCYMHALFRAKKQSLFCCNHCLLIWKYVSFPAYLAYLPWNWIDRRHKRRSFAVKKFYKL